jgi:hypothetical protein
MELSREYREIVIVNNSARISQNGWYNMFRDSDYEHRCRSSYNVWYAHVSDFNRLFFHYRMDLIVKQDGGECISKQIRHITSVLNLFVEKLMLGKGRQNDMLDFVELSVRFCLQQDRLLPLCPLCEIELKVEKARMIAPPVIPI